eukprot:757973-Hanusia_phi.AAC.2
MRSKIADCCRELGNSVSARNINTLNFRESKENLCIGTSGKPQENLLVCWDGEDGDLTGCA